jgi:hypothetical protein
VKQQKEEQTAPWQPPPTPSAPNLPAAQPAHVVAPVPVAVGHAKQNVLGLVRTIKISERYVSVGHSTHSTAPERPANQPAGHERQVVSSTCAPISVPYKPALQLIQLANPN